jgi:hypothetical protein
MTNDCNESGMAGLGAARGSAAASKPPKPFYTGNWLKCCDRCEHAEPHYCKLYSRPMKNMDVKRCRDWQERQNDQALPQGGAKKGNDEH